MADRKLVGFIALCVAAPCLMYVGGLIALSHSKLSLVVGATGFVGALLVFVLSLLNLRPIRRRASLGFFSCACCFCLLIWIPGWIRTREHFQQQPLKQEK